MDLFIFALTVVPSNLLPSFFFGLTLPEGICRNGFFSQNFPFESDLEGIENNLEVYFINFICLCVKIKLYTH